MKFNESTARKGKNILWHIWILFFIPFMIYFMYLAFINTLQSDVPDFKNIKYVIIFFDLVALGFVAIKEKGKFPVRYLVILLIIHFSFELLFFSREHFIIFYNFIYLTFSFILYFIVKYVSEKLN